MPATFRRRFIRQCLGVNRKVSTFRWILRQTVGVCQLSGAPCLDRVEGVKAEDGAEKSSSRRSKRKRVRGQRAGKRRSRGGKPRSNSPARPPASKGVSARCVNHSGRKFLWGERVRSQLIKTRYFGVLEQSLRRSPDDGAWGDEISPKWSSHLRALRSHARKSGIPDGANPFSRSAADFVRTNSSVVPEMAFHDILGGLRFNMSPAVFHEWAVGSDRAEEVGEPEPLERFDKPKKDSKKKNSSGAAGAGDFYGYRPVVATPVSGIVRPWERRGQENRRRRRPFRTTRQNDSLRDVLDR